MENIIPDIYELLKQSTNPIEAEESIQNYLYRAFSEILGEIFESFNQTIKEQKQSQGWKVKRNDSRTIQYIFGPVQFKRTLMVDPEGENHYPLDEWLGIKKRQRYSPLVEVKTAELVAKSTYRDTADFITGWTPVEMSHETVGAILGKVGKAQAAYDQALVKDLEEAAALPDGKKVEFMYAESDGAFVNSTEKNKKIEVRHAITYEGWEKVGERTILTHPKRILTTQNTTEFWKEVQTLTACEYTLENTRVITNSDGGKGYTPDKFQHAFSQSKYPVLNQLDYYHVTQSLNRTFGMRDELYKPKVRQAIQEKDLASFRKWTDTYESTLETEKDKEKLKAFKTYILGNWERIFDWRNKVKNPPKEAGRLGAMESNQRIVTYRMKRRGMHWSEDGCEAMVKVKQGILNGTLREAYLTNIHRTTRQQREDKRVISASKILQEEKHLSVGAAQGTIPLNVSTSSPLGQLAKNLRQ